MDGPVEIKPRFVDPVVATVTANTALAPNVATVATVDNTTANASTMMSSIYENKLIVLIVIVVILIISFIAYFWMRKEAPIQAALLPTIGAGGVNGVGGNDSAQTTQQAPQPVSTPQPQPAPQPAPKQTKEQLEAMLNKTKAAAAQAARAAPQPAPTPKTIPGSRSEEDLMNIMGYNRTAPMMPIVIVEDISIGVGRTTLATDSTRVTDVTDLDNDVGDNAVSNNVTNTTNSVNAEVESVEEDPMDTTDINPWLQDDFGNTPTLSPDYCSFILPSSRQCKNKPKTNSANGRCSKHGF